MLTAGEGQERFFAFCESQFVSQLHRKMPQDIPPSIETASSSVGTPSSSIDPHISTPTPIPSRRCESRKIDGTTWLLVARKANAYRKSHISGIWQHGAAYLDTNDLDGEQRWICDYCDTVVKHQEGLTSNVYRHLRDFHNISIKRKRDEISQQNEQDREYNTPQPREFRSLITAMNIESFRKLLIR